MIKEKIAGAEDFVVDIDPIVMDVWAKEFCADDDTLQSVIEFMFGYNILVACDDGIYMPELDVDLSHLRSRRERQKRYEESKKYNSTKNHTPKKKASTKPEEPKPKRKPPETPYVRIFKHNEEIAEKVLGFKPAVSYAMVSGMLKKLLANFTEQQIKDVITAGYEDETMVKFGLRDIAKILQSNHFNRILSSLKKKESNNIDLWSDIETPTDHQLLEIL